MSDSVFARPYPVMLNLSDQRALVVGGGAVGWRKAEGLLDAGAAVSVVAPHAVAEIRSHPDIRWHERPYRRGEAASYRLVITATDDAAVNAQVARDADAANVFVNSADDPQNCSFILPSVVRRGDLQIAISTNGRSPAFAQWLRRSLEASITDDHARALDIVSSVRRDVRARCGTSEIDGWNVAIDDRLITLVAEGDDDGARRQIYSALDLEPVGAPDQPNAIGHGASPTAERPHDLELTDLDTGDRDTDNLETGNLDPNGATL